MAQAYTPRYLFAGQDRVYHDASSNSCLPEVMATYGYERAFIITSRSLNRKTDFVTNLVQSLGDQYAGLTDKIGEHAPMHNVIAAAKAARDANADVLVAIGGGSVMDLSKLVQLCLTENCFDKQQLLDLQSEMANDGKSFSYAGAGKQPVINQIFLPSTMATAEWTPASTPVDEDTKQKPLYIMKGGSPETIIYDPELLALTPDRLLFTTAIRGLDHAINTRCAPVPHPLTNILMEEAIALFIHNLPKIKANKADREAMNNCCLATWFAGMGQLSVTHGFSHFMVHVLAPHCDLGHSEVAAVMMLANAKWIEEEAADRLRPVKSRLGREDESFYSLLNELLETMELPRTLDDLGVADEQIEEVIPHALKHPLLAHNNLRPLDNAGQLREVMALARSVQE